MSLRIDTSELIAGAYVVGETGLGVLAENIPSSGLDGASFVYNDLSLPADNGKEIRGLIVTPPASGTFYVWEDGSFSLIGAPDNTYPFTYRLYVDGVDLGTVESTITVGDAVSDPVSGGGMGFEMGGKKRRIVKIRWNGYDYTLDRDALPAFLESIEEQAEEKVTKKRNAKKKPAPLAKIVSAPADVMPDLKERIAAVNHSIGVLWGVDEDEDEELLWLML